MLLAVANPAKVAVLNNNLDSSHLTLTQMTNRLSGLIRITLIILTQLMECLPIIRISRICQQATYKALVMDLMD